MSACHFQSSDLHVIAVVNNPPRFASRERLFNAFVEQCKVAGVSLTVVEAAFQDRCHAHEHHAQHEMVNHVAVRQKDELWLKENLVNIGVSRLPHNWQYMAWIDGDVSFMRPDWAVETIHRLQHFAVVQMFQTAVDLGPNGEAFQTHAGFGHAFATGAPEHLVGGDYYGPKRPPGAFWHPGYAWAMNRSTFDDLGGLIDWGILGAGDHHMALSLVGQGHRAVPQGLHPSYMRRVMAWQERAERHVERDVGFVHGTILHGWHGRKKDRRYWDRWKILRDHQYDPDVDVKRDSQGLWILTHRGARMRNDLRRYFVARNEDSIDID